MYIRYIYIYILYMCIYIYICTYAYAYAYVCQIDSPGLDLRYLGSVFHRVIPGLVCIGGDITMGDGTGSRQKVALEVQSSVSWSFLPPRSPSNALSHPFFGWEIRFPY